MLPRAEGEVTFEGVPWKADLVYVDKASGQDYLIDVAIFNVDSDISVGSWRDLGTRSASSRRRNG